MPWQGLGQALVIGEGNSDMSLRSGSERIYNTEQKMFFYCLQHRWGKKYEEKTRLINSATFYLRIELHLWSVYNRKFILLTE